MYRKSLGNGVAIGESEFQVTPEGIRQALYFRKALLQHLVCGLEPVSDEAIGLRDYVKGAGGEVFETCVRQLASDDHGMADWLEVISMGTQHSCVHAMSVA